MQKKYLNNFKINFIFIIVLFLSLFFCVSEVKAASISWKTGYGGNLGNITIQQGKTATFTAETTGGNNVIFSCQNCLAWETVSDNGDGTALITLSPPADYGEHAHGLYVVATTKDNTSDFIKATLNVYTTVNNTAIKFTSNISSVLVEEGKTNSVTLTTNGGADVSLVCTNCLAWQTLKDNGDGTGILTLSPPAGTSSGVNTIEVKAVNKTNEKDFIVGYINISFVSDKSAPVWTSSVGEKKIIVDPGKATSTLVSATGGSKTSISCTNCTWSSLKDLGDGTAILTFTAPIGTPGGDYYVTLKAKNGVGEIDDNIGFTVTGKKTSLDGTLKDTSIDYKALLENQYPVPKDYNGPIPNCAFSGQCRSVADIIDILLRSAKYIFGIVGSVAFLFFVYGGFVMIFSAGSAERVKEGQQTIFWATIGLIIIFAAYFLVKLLMMALGVQEYLQALK